MLRSRPYPIMIGSAVFYICVNKIVNEIPTWEQVPEKDDDADGGVGGKISLNSNLLKVAKSMFRISWSL